MISNEELEEIAKEDEGSDVEFQESAMARALRPCRHSWNVIRLVEAGGRYQYCTLCGAKKVAE